MTLRERIADWISGGALNLAMSEANWRLHMIDGVYGPMVDEKNRHIIAANDALRTIAAMETPHANATVKRMAKTAREALGE